MLTNGLTPEAEYLCDLARAWASGVPGPVPPVERLDAPRLLHLLANQPAMQTVAGLADRALFSADENQQLDRTLEICRRRTTTILLELERILTPLADAGCRPLILKGASLALMAYKNPEDRWFVDLDLLVDPDLLDTTYAVLGRLGYAFTGSERTRRYYDRFHFHRMLLSTQGVCIEAHWALTLPHSVYRYDLDVLLAQARPLTVGSVTAMAPHPADQILHGVLQSVAGGFADLRRVLDLDRLERLVTDADREGLCERARRNNLATGLWLQYRLREIVLGDPVPAVVDRTCRPAAALVRICEGLDLGGNCLERQLSQPGDFAQLVHWICTPAHRRAGQVLRYLIPGEEARLSAEINRGEPLGPTALVRLFLERAADTGRNLGLLARAAL